MGHLGGDNHSATRQPKDQVSFHPFFFQEIAQPSTCIFTRCKHLE
jgi:hypothetical protein